MNEKVLPMISVIYPDPDFNIRQEEDHRMIWDKVRKKFVTLSVEEWVRQNFIAYLTKVKAYPMALMAVEKEIRLGDLKKRCDIVIYKNSIPWMIIECKEPKIQLTEKTLRQILGYNMTLQVPYLILTNGDNTVGLKRTNHSAAFLSSLPDYH